MKHTSLAALGMLLAVTACESFSDTSGGGATGPSSSSATGGSGGSSTSTTTSSSSTTSTGPGGSGGMAGAGGSAGGSGGVGGNGGCQWSTSNPCGNGFYCKAPGCGAGSCEPIPTMTDSAKSPVCGCDGVHYWNSATAGNLGMSIGSMGVCTQDVFCGGFGNLACPNPQGHSCSKLLSKNTECNISDPGGACWGMPATCLQIGFGGTWRSCASPQGVCQYECDARKLETTHYVDNTCPQ
jgi:hypothetical protein